MQRALAAFILFFPAGAAAQSDTAAPASPCGAAEFQQFNFWVGRWDVSDAKGNQVANSLIEKVYGCGIRENWMPFKGGPGGSLSIYIPKAKGWQQFWIDAGGSRVIFDGGWNGQAMVLTGEWNGPLVRMTYSANAADRSVRQLGEQSKDGGKTWSTAFDLTYRPHDPDQPFPTPRQ